MLATITNINLSYTTFRFAGEQFDEALGDYYLRSRYYDADTGRFTTRDTYEGRLAEPLTLHKYIYAHDNPVNFTDPTGLYGTSLVEFNVGQAIADALTVGIGVSSIVSRSYEPERLGGFGENERPRSVLDGLLIWRNTWAPETLGGFGEGSQPTVEQHTGHSNRDINDLIRYLFAISADPWELAYDIAYGHAWNPARILEWEELGIQSQDELAERIYDIITISYESKKVDGDKTIYLGSDGTIVVENPRDPDGGTAFNPNIQKGNNTTSRDYFDLQPGTLED